MKEELTPIEWPKGGLVDAWSFSEQPQMSAREYQNVRTQDPTNGRLSGAQRSGLSKHLPAALKTAGVKAAGLVHFILDNRQVTYASLASETATWSTAVPSDATVNVVKTDRQGNVYVVDGKASVVKYSSDGNKLWQLAVPTGDPEHSILTLLVDENEFVYVGVSSGGDEKKAKIFCFSQEPENKTEELWRLETKAYSAEMVIFDDKLYVAQNMVSRARSFVRVYDFIDSASVRKVNEWRVPYPVNSIAVKKDGSVIVACPASGDTTYYMRTPDPLFPEATIDSVDWTPDQLSNSVRRIWAHFKSDTIDETDVSGVFEEGQEISRWRDSSRNNRHHYARDSDGSSDVGPLLALDAWLGYKGVRFTQADNASAPDSGTFQVLKSLKNSSVTKTSADTQRTLLPAYVDSGWACYIVCRPAEAPPGSTHSRWLIGQSRDDHAAPYDDPANAHLLMVNCAESGVTVLFPLAFTQDSGHIFWWIGDTVTAGGGTGGRVNGGDFDIRSDSGTNPGGGTTNLSQMVIISMICDGGVTSHDSRFAVNGTPIDLFTQTGQQTVRASYIGASRVTPQPNGGPIPSSNTGGFVGDIYEILVLDLNDRNASPPSVLTFDALEITDPGSSQTINEDTLITGYLAHKYGIVFNLPHGTPATGNYPHPFGITGTGQDQLWGPPNLAGTAVSRPQSLANKRFACVVKYTPEGKIVWTANEMELNGSSERSGGYGYAVAVNSDGNIYSIGPAPTGTGSAETVQIRMIVDSGSDFSITNASAWSDSLSAGADLTYQYLKVDVDMYDNLYVPLSPAGITNGAFRVFKKDGTVLHTYVTVAPATGRCIAVDRRIPDYRDDLGTNQTVEHVLIGGSAAEVGLPTLAKVRLVGISQMSGSSRTHYSLGVSDGDIVRFTTSAVSSITGGTGALDADARYVQATTLYRKAYWTDGRQYKVFSPITNEVSEYKCLSAGEMPPKCALIEQWRGRIVLARSADDPHNWFMSKKDEPTNWDYFPPVVDETSAVAGNNSVAGLCPDVINSVVPYSEDILVFGGDHSIWMLVGDPAAGGRLELVSDTTGMAFGRPWCKDPNGVLYFLGSRGGLFRWKPGTQIERVSLYKIERQLQEIDFGSYHIKLAWNHDDEGIHILQLPFGAGGTQVSHWFYEAKMDGFSKDIFGTTTHTNVQPTDVIVIDGDAYDDRVVAFGCEDGYIRVWDQDSKSDDTQTDGSTMIAIDALVTMFPIGSVEKFYGMETQFHGLTLVLGDRYDGCRWEMFASDEPDSLGIPRTSGVVGPGRNPPSWEKVTGSYCGVRLRNAAPEERFSYERGYIYASLAGMSRPRMKS